MSRSLYLALLAPSVQTVMSNEPDGSWMLWIANSHYARPRLAQPAALVKRRGGGTAPRSFVDEGVCFYGIARGARTQGWLARTAGNHEGSSFSIPKPLEFAQTLLANHELAVTLP